MSLRTVGKNLEYVLPASHDAVPECFKSNTNPKSIPCSLQTVNVPALSGNASASGTSIIQLPLGNSAGFISNPYIRFTVTLANAGAVATSSFSWKGASGCATACINSIQTYVNSTQIDNQNSVDMLYDTLLSHSSSNDWLTHDGQVLLGSNLLYLTGAATSFTATYCVPLLGLLGSQQSFCAFLCNGVLQIQIQWNSLARMYGYTTADPAWTSATFSDIQFVYDRISPEQAFVDSVRSSMSSGQKFVYSYSNFQTVPVALSAGQNQQNVGLNVSSLRGVVCNQVLTADLSATNAFGYSVPNGLSQFLISLDGRLINSNQLTYLYSQGAAVVAPKHQQAVVFAEMQRSLGRIFDASLTDLSTASTYNTSNFAVGVSAQRINESLAFSGSPVSIVSLQTTVTAGSYTLYAHFMSDFQLLIDSSGSVEICR